MSHIINLADENKNKEKSESPPTTPFGVIQPQGKLDWDNKIWWIIDRIKKIDVNEDDLNHSARKWEKYAKWMNNLQYVPTIPQIEQKLKLLVLDKYEDDEKNQMVCYGMMIKLDDLNDNGWSDEQMYTLLMDENFKKVKLEDIGFNRSHIWSNWFRWMQLVEIKRAVHLADPDKEIDAWIFIQFDYYNEDSLFAN